jgi:hypothetical protein
MPTAFTRSSSRWRTPRRPEPRWARTSWSSRTRALVLETDPTAARSRLRAIFGGGFSEARNPYLRHYRRLGYGEEDLAGQRSDRLIDDTLAWGDEKAVATRLTAHLEAGADHVLVHPFAAGLPSVVDQLERLAPLLFGAD